MKVIVGVLYSVAYGGHINTVKMWFLDEGHKDIAEVTTQGSIDVKKRKGRYACYGEGTV